MNRKILLLNVCLLALLASIGWMLRVRWLDARAKERAVLSQAAHHTELLPPPTPPLPVPANASEYPEVVAKTLFSKDRDPNVAPVIEAPPPPKPEEPIPPRPVYHGQMGFSGEPVAFLSIDGKSTQRSYQVGDSVGPFKLLAFDHEQMKLEWNGKTLEYKLSELTAKEAPVPQPQAGQPAPPPPTSAKPATSNNQTPAYGAANGDRRDCVVTDRSPSGTIKDGYKKVVFSGMIGEICYWEQVK
jgi:hypothetical protein